LHDINSITGTDSTDTKQCVATDENCDVKTTKASSPPYNSTDNESTESDNEILHYESDDYVPETDYKDSNEHSSRSFSGLENIAEENELLSRLKMLQKTAASNFNMAIIVTITKTQILVSKIVTTSMITLSRITITNIITHLIMIVAVEAMKTLASLIMI